VFRGAGGRRSLQRALAGLAAPVIATACVVVLPASSSAAPSRPGALASTTSFRVDSVAVVPGGTAAWAAVTSGMNVAPYTRTAGMWRWSGSKWVTSTLPHLGASSFMDKVVAVSASDAWAIGSGGTSTHQSPFLLHFTGAAWKTVALPTNDRSGYFGELAVSGSAVWLAGAVASKAVVLRYDGTWSTKNPPATASESIDAIAAQSPTELWIVLVACTSVCSSTVLEPTSTGWKSLTVGSKTYVASISVFSSTHVLLAGSKTVGTALEPMLDSVHGTTLSPITVRKTLANGNLDGVVQPSSTVAWVVGLQDTKTAYQILVDRLDGTKWVQEPVKVSGKNAFDQALGAGSATDAFVFGTSWAGAVCRSAATTVGYRWTGSKWATVSMPAPPATVRSAGVLPRC
jgi:hypothetical protein